MEDPRLVKLGNLIGAKLHLLCRGDLLIDGEPSLDDLGPLELVFESGSSLQLRLASDGESVELQLSPTRQNELLGQGGAWPRVELSNDPKFSHLCGQMLVAINAIYFGSDSGGDETLAGLIFRLGSGESLTYYNAGDFAKIYINEVPPPLPEPFYLRFVDTLVGT